MAIYDTGTASLAANGRVTGVGTQWTMPLTLIRVGATIIFKTNPIKIYTISEIVSGTSISVYNPKNETVPAGTGYAILAHDGISVQGLAQDVAETLRYYQSKETSIQSLIDFIGQDSFDWPRFEQLANQSVTGAAEALASQIAAAESAATAVSARNTTTEARDATIQAINNAGDAGTLVTLAGIGIASNQSKVLSSLDWQQFDFKVGGSYRCLRSAMTNTPPTNLTQNQVCYINVNGNLSSNGSLSITLRGYSQSDINSRIYEIDVAGALGSRSFSVRESIQLPVSLESPEAGGAVTSRLRERLDVYSKSETLSKSANFSDVANKVSARSNLDVYSRGEVIGGYVTPEEFGATGDGVTDDVLALRSCFEFAASSPTRKRVTGMPGSNYYTSSTVTIPVGIVEITNISVRSDYTSGPVFSTELTSSYDGLSFNNVTLDLMGAGQRGVIFSGIKNSKIYKNRIFNFGSSQSESYGIRIGTTSTSVINEFCDVYGNTVTMPIDPTGGLGSFGWAGIYLLAPNNTLSDGSIDWSNQYNTIRYVNVYENICTGGTHNIQAMGLFNVNIQNNTLDGGSHRNINLGFGSQRILISSNKLLGTGSAAVIFGGARFVKITGNYIQSASTSSIQTDDAAIQFAQGCYSIDVSDNSVYGSWDYGVNLFNSSDVRISSNYFESAMAGVAIQSSQVLSVPATAIYTRSRNVTELVSSVTSRISLSGNTYKSGSSGCCIYLASLNSVQISDVSISGEQFTGAGIIQHAIYVYQGAAGQISRVSLDGVSAPMISTGKYYSAYGRNPFRRVDNVDGLEDDFVEISVPATSDVSAFYGPNIAISSSGTINNFTGGIDGQQIHVRLTSGVVIVNNSSLIRLKGSVNYTATSSNEIISLTRRSGIWFESSRNS